MHSNLDNVIMLPATCYCYYGLPFRLSSMLLTESVLDAVCFLFLCVPWWLYFEEL